LTNGPVSLINKIKEIGGTKPNGIWVANQISKSPDHLVFGYLRAPKVFHLQSATDSCVYGEVNFLI
jgi:hypothetical protein